MAQKRLCDTEIIDEISSKHPRYNENDYRNLSPLNVETSQDDSEKPYLPGKGNLDLEKPGNGFERVNWEDSGNSNVGGPQTNSLSPCATQPCATHNSLERKVHELVVHMPFLPEYLYFDCSVRHLHYEDPYSSMLDNTPRKLVPVGLAHQADIPELSVNIPTEKKDELAGICIIPSRELDDSSPSNSVETVASRYESCTCPDMGSTRCVKQHITETREKLKGTLEAVVFKELGFYEMGEVVADRWLEEDEVLFHKVVHSNPASLGKNFWNILQLVFPSRTHMELVSYYFNVFILRKRAAQNRYDPKDIDSDDDQWQLTEDNAEGGRTDEEDDSAVEFPVEHYSGSNAFACYSDDGHGLNEHVDDSSHNSSPGQHPRITQDLDKEHYGDSGDNDVQDRSCTSFDFGSPTGVPAEAKGDCNKDWHGFVLEPCDGRAWERYPSCSKTETAEFLPTYSVIEEVLGDASSLSLQS